VLDKICHPLTSQPGDYRFFAEMVKQKNSISNQVGTKDATDHAAILLPPGVA
jgi:hypothetical protein